MIRIEAAAWDDFGNLVLAYEHPDKPGESHQHTLMHGCWQDRCVVYGVNPVQAVEQIVLEDCARSVVDPNRFPSKADRHHAHVTHGPVAGLQQALTTAGITLPGPTEEQAQVTRRNYLTHFGPREMERARGVPFGSLSEDPEEPWPTVPDPHAPPHPNTPK